MATKRRPVLPNVDNDAHDLLKTPQNELKETIERYKHAVEILKDQVQCVKDEFEGEDREWRLNQLIKAANRAGYDIQAYTKKHHSEYLKGKPPWHLRQTHITKRWKGLQELLEYMHHSTRTTNARRKFYRSNDPIGTVKQVTEFNEQVFGIPVPEGHWPLSLIKLDEEFYEEAAAACECSVPQVKKLVVRLRKIGALRQVDIRRTGPAGKVSIIADGYFVEYEGTVRKQTFFTKKIEGKFLSEFGKTPLS